MPEASSLPAYSLGITLPRPQTVFHISKQAVWPSIVIQSEASGGQQFNWQWSMHWHTFSRQGTATTQSDSWDAGPSIANLGGTLNVAVTGPYGSDAFNLQVIGDQPEVSDVMQYLGKKPNSAGFDRILNKETRMRHFDEHGEPIRSFDNGYGIAQLTKPSPTYEEAWNWKKNIDAAIGLYQTKQTAAIVYLSQGKRVYTDEQLQRETISRWNGGAYHVWDAAKGWLRNPNILWDSATGNIGWNMTRPENAGHTQSELHDRDAGNYRKGRPGANDCWGYFGVCYADSILG